MQGESIKSLRVDRTHPVLMRAVLQKRPPNCLQQLQNELGLGFRLHPGPGLRRPHLRTVCPPEAGHPRRPRRRRDAVEGVQRPRQVRLQQTQQDLRRLLRALQGAGDLHALQVIFLA